MSESNDSVEVTVSALSGAALDWAVATAQGWKLFHVESFESPQDGWGRDIPFRKEIMVKSAWRFWHESNGVLVFSPGHYQLKEIDYKPSTDWRYCGPLIDKHAIGFWSYDADNWQAQSSPEDVVYTGIGPTHLVAACRLIVAAKFGKVISVPKELIS